MTYWIKNFSGSQVVYFAACEILYRGLMALGVKAESLGNHFEILAGYAFKSDDYTTTGIPLLRNINVKPDRIDWTDAVHLPPDKAREFDRFRLFSGDLVLSMDGTVNKQGIKIAFLSTYDIPSLLLQRVCRFEPAGNVEKRFLYHMLHTEDFLNHLDNSNRSIAIPHVSPGQLKSFCIPVPAKDLQKLICNFLDAALLGEPSYKWPALPPLAEQRRIVARIEELAAQIEEARALRRETTEEAAMLLARATMAVLDDKPWPRLQLGDLLSENPRNGLGPQPDAEDGRVMLRINAVSSAPTRFVDMAAAKKVSVPDNTARPFVIRDNDVFIVRFNGDIHRVAKAAIYKGHNDANAVYPDKLIRLRPDPAKMMPDFLVYALGSRMVRDQIERLGRTTAGNIGISGSDSKSFVVPVPPVPQQARIVSELDDLQAEMDYLKKLQAETAAELDALLPSILDRAFRGELKDPGATAPETCVCQCAKSS